MVLGLLAHLNSASVQAHSPEITGWKELWLHGWYWDPWTLLSLGISTLIYLFWVRFSWNRKTVLFLCGQGILFLALVSPIASIGESYLFSVHMIQHLLLTLVAAPLLILGLPIQISAYFLRWRPLRNFIKKISHPFIAWSLGTTSLWILHLPSLYESALQHRGIHALQHLGFVMGATLFWFPLLEPAKRFRLSGPQALLYLFAACAVDSLLAILLTFSSKPLYPSYWKERDPLGALTLIREFWGLIPELDQQAGGALMWTLGGLALFIAFVGVLAHWFSKTKETES